MLKYVKSLNNFEVSHKNYRKLFQAISTFEMKIHWNTKKQPYTFQLIYLIDQQIHSRWRASIYKLVYMDLALFLVVYYSLSFLYRVVLDDEHKLVFEQVVQYCTDHSSQIPLSFVLGFYVTIVMTRWWQQYISIPWPDSIAVYVSSTIHGNDERGRLMRRTIIRFVVGNIPWKIGMYPSKAN